MEMSLVFMRISRKHLSSPLASGLVLLAAIGPGLAKAAEKGLGDLTGPWQLFVDDYLIEEMQGVVRTYHPFDKHPANPVLKPERPWEGIAVFLHGNTVLPSENGKGYRMWYHAWHHDKPAYMYLNLYATSENGIDWERPNLGLFEFEGSKANNIFIHRTSDDTIPQIIHTPWEADPKRRYKLINYCYGRFPPEHVVSGYYGATSPDGIHWTDAPDNPILIDRGDVGQFVWDPHRKRYFGTPKIWTNVRGVPRRCIGFSETTDFDAPWPRARLILVPDQIDDRWGTGNQRTEFYGLGAFAYESMYIGFLWIFRITDGDNDGTIHPELVSSRDGYHWDRMEGERAPLVPVSPAGNWDQGMIYAAHHPLVDGDTLRLYYGGCDGTHVSPTGYGHAGVGLATLRKDGFASLDAGDTPGTVTTRKLTNVQGTLAVNYDARGGWLRVEVLDEASEVIPGFDRKGCDVLTRNSVSQVVTWKGRKSLPTDGRTARLRFIMSNTSLYSFLAGDDVKIDFLGRKQRAVLYTFEGDRGEQVKDRLVEDGAQALFFQNQVVVEESSSNAAFGSGCVAFSTDGPEAPMIEDTFKWSVKDSVAWNTLEIADTFDLGERFTLAAMVKSVDNRLTRLFSGFEPHPTRYDKPPYNRDGLPVGTNELIFDFEPDGSALNGCMRLVANGQEVVAPGTFRPGNYHHLAATYDNGTVVLYLDGQRLGGGRVPAGPVRLLANLRVGEDWPPLVEGKGSTTNEQLRGHVDDIMILGRVLTATEVEKLAREGAEASLVGDKSGR